MERTNYNGELRLSDVGKKVTLLGWVAKKRNLGSLVFIDLRDRTGIVQVLVNDNVEIPDVRNEYVVEVRGTVSAKEVPNKKLATGEIEVIAESVVVLSKASITPMIIADDTDALEDTRLKYRYLDLRNPAIHKNIVLRSKVISYMRSLMEEKDFLDIQTPILTASSPEGARDFLVPSRKHKGKFYALPQAPHGVAERREDHRRRARRRHHRRRDRRERVRAGPTLSAG